MNKDSGLWSTSLLPLLLLTLFLCAPGSAAQTLAHRGWANSGLEVQPWWVDAVFYQVSIPAPADRSEPEKSDSSAPLGNLASRLPLLKNLGVDAIVLSPARLSPHPRPATVPAADGQASAATPQGQATARPDWSLIFGSPDDFDHLQQETSRLGMRLLIDLPLSASQSTSDVLAGARFWLSRGVSGLRLTTEADAQNAAASHLTSLVEQLCATYPGERVLIEDPELVSAERTASGKVQHAGRSRRRAPASVGNMSGPGPKHLAAHLVVDDRISALPTWNAQNVRAFLQSLSGPAVHVVGASPVRAPFRLALGFNDLRLTASPTEEPAIARMRAALLLTQPESPLLGGDKAGQNARQQPGTAAGPAEPETVAGGRVESEDTSRNGPDSLFEWYRTLIGIRHTQPALRARGSLRLLETGYPDVLAWVRTGTPDGAGTRKSASAALAAPLLVLLNFRTDAVVVSLGEALRQAHLAASSGLRPLASSPASAPPSFNAEEIHLAAHGVLLAEIRQSGLESTSATFSPHRHHRGR